MNELSEYNQIKITNEYTSRNEYQTAHIGSGSNLIPPTPDLKEPNTAPTNAVRRKKRTVKIGARVISAVIAVAGATMVGVTVAEELDLLTPIVQIVFAENNAQIELVEGPNGITFALHVLDYTPLGDLSLAVLDAYGNPVWQSPFVASFSSQGEMVAECSVDNLASDTDYTLCLYENTRLLWSRSFKTAAAPAPISYLVDNAEVSLEPTDTALYYTIGLPEYAVVTQLSAVVTDTDGATFSGEISTEADQELNTLYVYGYHPNLTPQTQYSFRLFDGDRLLYQTSFATAQPVVVPAPIEAHLSTEADRVIYYFSFPSDFAPQNELVAHVTDGETQFVGAVDLSQDGDGLWICEGYVAELSAAKQYTFTLNDGDTALYQAAFTTEAAAVEVSVTLSPASDSVSFVVVLPGTYQVQSELLACVTEKAAPENAFETDLGLEDDEDGNRVGEGTLADLTSDTIYTFYIYDGETMLYQEDFATEAAQPIVTQVVLTPGPNELSFTFTMAGNYEEQSMLTVVVAEKIAPENTYETEFGRDLDNNGNYSCGGEMGDLNPETSYEFYVKDGDTVLYQDVFITTVYVAPIASMQLSATLDSVSFHFELDEHYSVQDQIAFELYDGNNTQSVDVTVNERIGAGTIVGLTPSTTYTVYVYDGWDVIYSDSVTTESLPEITDVSLTPTLNDVEYTFSLPSTYQAQTGLRVVVQAVNDPESVYESNVTPTDSGNDLWVFAGVLNDLSSATDYTFYIYDGELVLYQENFATEAEQPIIDDVNLAPTHNELSFSFTMAGSYVEQSGFMAVAAEQADPDSTYETEFGREEDGQGNWTCEGTITDLKPASNYILYVYDGETVLYSQVFTTNNEPVSMQLSPTYNSVSFHFEMDEHYTVQDILTFQVYDGDVNESMQVTLNDRVGEGVVEGLAPGSTYSVYLYDGGEVIYYDEFTTEEAPTVLSAELTPDVFGVAFSITLNGDYAVAENLTAVAENGNGAMDIQVTPADDGNGNLLCEDYINDLPPGQTYTFYLYDGETVLWQGEFTTLSATAEVELTPDSSSVSYSFIVHHANALDGTLRVEVTDGEDVRSDYPSYDDIAVYEYAGESVVADLTPATTYTFTLYDGDTVLWQNEFTTSEP